MKILLSIGAVLEVALCNIAFSILQMTITNKSGNSAFKQLTLKAVSSYPPYRSL